MTALFERYRPAIWAEVVGQDKVVAQIDFIRQRGLGGKAYWLSGSSGTGKTTIARLLAGAIAEPFNVTEVDANEVSLDWLRDAERVSPMYGLGARSGRAYIINEAHGLKGMVLRKLDVMLEDLPNHVLWAFTTTSEGEELLFESQRDAGPFMSRCIPLPLARRDITRPMAERCKMILEREGLDGLPIERYVSVLKEERNNMRAVLQRGERGDFISKGKNNEP